MIIPLDHPHNLCECGHVLAYHNTITEWAPRYKPCTLPPDFCTLANQFCACIKFELDAFKYVAECGTQKE